jgi:hypothetical protein
VAGGSANYVNKIAEYFSLLAGLDYEREAPRRDDLDHYGFFNPTTPAYYGPFTPVDGNNVTIGSVTPYIASEGGLAHYFRYYLGWRRDEISFDNDDLLQPQNSFQKWVGVNSPKATVSFLPKESWYVPLVSLSFGQASSPKILALALECLALELPWARPWPRRILIRPSPARPSTKQTCGSLWAT